MKSSKNYVTCVTSSSIMIYWERGEAGGQRSFDDHVGQILLKNDHGCDGRHNASKLRKKF